MKMLALTSAVCLSLLIPLSNTAASPTPSNEAAHATRPSSANPASLEMNEKGVEALRAKNFTKAEEYFRAALAADTGNVTAAFNLAGMYISDKKQSAAISLLDTYIQVAPKDPGLYARRADANFSLKNLEAAEKDYDQAFKLDPQYPGVAAKLGTIYTLQRHTDKAEQMFLAAVEIDPKNAQLLQNLSNIFLVNGKTEKAISTAKRGLQVTPSADLYVTLGNAYETLKDYKNSLIAFQRAADLGDSRPQLKQKIDALKKVAS